MTMTDTKTMSSRCLRHRHVAGLRDERQRLRSRDGDGCMHAGYPLHGGARGRGGSHAAVMDANLFDMDQKYADVVALGEAMDYLNSFALKN